MKDFEQLSRAALLVEDALGSAPAHERLEALRQEPLIISLRPGMGRRGQVMVANVANIAGRLFDYLGPIDLDIPDEKVLPGVFAFAHCALGAKLPTATAQLLQKLRVHPDGADISARPRHRRYRRGIAIGGPPVGGVDGIEVDELIVIDASDWVAAVGPDAVLLPDARVGAFNPFGAVVAAALGATELAKSFFRFLSVPVPAREGVDGAVVAGAVEGRSDGFEPLEASTIWDLWSHEVGGVPTGPALPELLDLGEIGIAGVGALGAAAVAALSQLRCAAGGIELVDDDILSSTNLERVLTALGEDVGEKKTVLAKRALRQSQLRCRIIGGRYGRALPRGARAATILVGVDSGQARRHINQFLPEAVYNGGTQGSEIMVSRHVHFEGPCVECLYPEIDDPIGRLARRLGADRETAKALDSGERKLDGEILAGLLERGGVEFRDVDIRSLQGEPLQKLLGYECSRAVVIEDLPEATIGFVSALGGFLMACELVKDQLQLQRALPLDAARPVFRLDLLRGPPTRDCVESYVPRRDCFCQEPDVRGRIAGLRGEVG
jgi:molybdopterin/thiamine biosynthesis adenylyltransferase